MPYDEDWLPSLMMEIHPKTFGDALNEWFRSLGRNWKPLLVSSLSVHIPLGVVMTIIFWWIGATEIFQFYTEPETLETLTDAEILELMTPFLWAMVIWTILQLLATVFVYMAAARTVAADMAGVELSPMAVTRFGISRTPTGVASLLLVLVGAATLVGAAVAIGWSVISGGGVSFFTVFLTATAALTALVVLIWLGVSVSLAAQSIAVEGVGAASALRRSFELVQSRWWATLGFILVVSLIVSAASQVVSIALVPLFLGAAVAPVFGALAFGASTVMQGPLIAAVGAAYAIWYVDLRAREEPLTGEQLI